MSKSLFLEAIATAVLTVLIAFTGILFPWLASFFWGVPIAVFTARRGLKPGLLAAVAALGMLMILISPRGALLSALQFGSLGLALGYFFIKGSPSRTIMMQTMAVSLAVTIFAFVFPYFPANPIDAVASELSGSIDAIIAAWEDVGILNNLPQEYAPGELREMLQEAVAWFIWLLPSLLVVSAMGTAFFNFLTSRWTLARKDYQVADFPRFSRWWVPWYTSWVAVFGLGFALLGDYVSAGSIRILGLNLVVLHLPIAVVVGFSVIVFFFSKIKSWLFQAALVFMAFFYLPLTALLIAIIGVFDPLFDFRKIHFKSV